MHSGVAGDRCNKGELSNKVQRRVAAAAGPEELPWEDNIGMTIGKKRVVSSERGAGGMKDPK